MRAAILKPAQAGRLKLPLLQNSNGVDTGRSTKTSQFQTFQIITKSTAGDIKK